MNVRTAVINLGFYTDATAIHPNDNSDCVIRRNENGSFSVQVNWDRPSRVYPILAVDYRMNNRVHREFVAGMKKELKHMIHDHITSIQNLLTAFICGVKMVDDDYPIDKHEVRHDDILCVKKTVLENHWQTTMTQYRGLSRRIKEEIGRVFCMESHCTVILSDEAEASEYDITNNFEKCTAAQLLYQRELTFVDEIREMGNGKLSNETQQWV